MISKESERYQLLNCLDLQPHQEDSTLGVRFIGTNPLLLLSIPTTRFTATAVLLMGITVLILWLSLGLVSLML